ncbi:MAG: PTS sugar transporter subunit IIC [Clostridiales bacterium]|nr:PTS sugar transporter subunit IIC [Clostridiales bacterium]
MNEEESVESVQPQTEAKQPPEAVAQDAATTDASDAQVAQEAKPKKTGRVKAFIEKYFVTAFSGMALGLFCTLIAGTIVGQIGTLIGTNKVGLVFTYIGTAAKTVMGAGIGAGIAHAFKTKKLTMFTAVAAGLIGANMTNIFTASGIKVWGATPTAGFALAIGDPVASYIAVVFAVRVTSLFEGKTPVDIILVPLAGILTGTVAAIVLGIPFGMLFSLLGKAVSKAVRWEPISFGILVSVIMGLLLTLPTSSAAFGVMLFKPLVGTSLEGAAALAAAAACAGCCAHMIGFAVASFRENKWGGLLSQGLGTSMLQIPNLAGNPLILIPAVAASAVAGPLTSAVFKLQCDFTGSGMGTAGLVGVIQTISVSHGAGLSWLRIILGVGLCYFIVPAVVALLVSELMRHFKKIKYGDMLLK